MPKFPPIKCVIEEIDQEVDPALWDSAIEILARLAIKEYIARHPKLPAPEFSQLPKDPPSETPSRQPAPPKTDKPEGRLVDVAALSKHLSLPKATIYTWVSLKKFPPAAIVRLGRSLRFDLREIDIWIDRNRDKNPGASSSKAGA